MKSYRQGSHSLFDLKVHVVWITKYRKPVLSGNVRLDHVHLLVLIPPKLRVSMRVSKLMQRLKGVNCIAQYIKKQDEIERRGKNDNFTVGF